MPVFVTFNVKKSALLLVAVPLMLLSLFLKTGEAQETLSDEAEKVLIIDAGHGGEDGGASSADGLLESGINLAIALRLEALAGLYGQDAVMTRNSDKITYPDSATTTAKRKAADQQARIGLINSYSDAVLVSIHQNCFPDSRPFGCQVLYAETDGSEEFAKLTHEKLSDAICPENRRVAAPASKDVFIMRSVKCPAILVECGFLSNENEAALLATDTYQTKISAVLLASYLQYLAQPSGMVT